METLFRKALGDTPKIRVIEFLIEGRDIDYSITDIAEGSNIGRTTLFRIFQDMLETEVIILTREIGNSKLYKINKKNPFARKMIEIFDEIVLPEKQLKELDKVC